MTRKKSAPDFEKALAELETIVNQLEQGDLPLEDSLSAFEKGVKLTRDCQQALDSAEQKVQLLLQKQDGSVELTDFDTDAED